MSYLICLVIGFLLGVMLSMFGIIIFDGIAEKKMKEDEYIFHNENTLYIEDLDDDD